MAKIARQEISAFFWYDNNKTFSTVATAKSILSYSTVISPTLWKYSFSIFSFVLNILKTDALCRASK